MSTEIIKKEDVNKLVTVQELVEILGVGKDSIINATHKYFPTKIKNGKKTLYNEKEVTIIKKEISNKHNLRSTQKLNNVKTNLEEQIELSKAIKLCEKNNLTITDNNTELLQIFAENQKIMIENQQLMMMSDLEKEKAKTNIKRLKIYLKTITDNSDYIIPEEIIDIVENNKIFKNKELVTWWQKEGEELYNNILFKNYEKEDEKYRIPVIEGKLEEI